MSEAHFDCAPGLRLEAHERLAKLQFDNISMRLDKIETLIERLERRLWMTMFGMICVICPKDFNNCFQPFQIKEA